MSVSDTDIAFVHDMFDPLGQITTRKMMGGLSIYCDGTIFAMLDREGTLYLKAKGTFADEMAAAGGRQFGVDTGDVMAYWTLPDTANYDPDAALIWGQKALDAL